MDLASLDARNTYFNGNTSGVVRSSSQSCIATANPSTLISNDPQRTLTELKLDSYGYIRANTDTSRRSSVNKRKSIQWIRVTIHLNGSWLTFHKVQNGLPTNIPIIQINTALIHHARRVTGADIRSAEEKQLSLIFQATF